jgi:hypothetical protein
MTTARKPRSTPAARKTTGTPETSSEKNTVTAKTRSKPAKTITKKATTPNAAHDASLAGSAVGVAAAQEAATETSAMSATLEGGAAPGVQAGSADVPHRMIAVAAYYRAERRGFAPGGEVMDWLQAEAELRGTQRR